jgi:hypothetical protein
MLSITGVAILDIGDSIFQAVSAHAASICATQWLEDSALPMIHISAN